MAQEKFTSLEDLMKAHGSGKADTPKKGPENPPPRQQSRNDRNFGGETVSRPELLTPADTAEKVKVSSAVEHFGLKMTKYLIRNPQNSQQKLAEYNFKEWSTPNFDLTEKSRKDLLSAQKKSAESLVEPGSLFQKELRTTWRLALGLGNENVLETSMTLHHTYGFPYIPGQALKGVVRSYVVNMFFGSEEVALNNIDFCRIFGGDDKAMEDRAGNIIFFDALPAEKPEVLKDIMNPHFSPYYSETYNKPPGDYYDPNPVLFWTVKNTSFLFMAGLKRGKEGKLITDVFGNGDMITVVGEWIEKSLSIFGIGAKTSVGYGRFE